MPSICISHAARLCLRLPPWGFRKHERRCCGVRGVFGCFLQATRALHAIIQEPVCAQVVKAFFPQFFLALLFQMVFTAEFTHQEANIFLRECQRDEFRACSHVRCWIPVPLSLLRTWRQGQAGRVTWALLCMQVRCGGHERSLQLRWL